MFGIRGRLVVSVVTVSLALLVACGRSGRSGGVEQPVFQEEIYPASVATFGVHALIAAGLQERHAVFFQYSGVEEDEDGWVVLVAGGAHDLHVSVEDDQLLVDDFSGFKLVRDRAESMLGFREAVPPAEPGYEFFNIDLVKRSKIEGRTKGPLLESSFFWTGPIPSDVYFTCHVEITDASGELIYTGEDFERDPPLSEQARTGGLYYEKVPSGALDGEAEILCERKQ